METPVKIKRVEVFKKQKRRAPQPGLGEEQNNLKARLNCRLKRQNLVQTKKSVKLSKKNNKLSYKRRK